MSYCQAITQMVGDKKILHAAYHDTLYGFPIHNDDELFGRLILEINQAGLSWETILKKELHFRKAYSNFSIKSVAGYTEGDIARLLANTGIIRNRLKINAAIKNAKAIVALQKEHGSFENWLDHHHPQSKAEWVKLFKKAFTFTGGEIVGEFLMSTGYLHGAHDEGCPVFEEIELMKPRWLE